MLKKESLFQVVPSTIMRNICSVVQVLDTSRKLGKDIRVSTSWIICSNCQFYNENKDTKDRYIKSKKTKV